jgi:hypothetical protein
VFSHACVFVLFIEKQNDGENMPPLNESAHGAHTWDHVSQAHEAHAPHIARLVELHNEMVGVHEKQQALLLCFLLLVICVLCCLTLKLCTFNRGAMFRSLFSRDDTVKNTGTLPNDNSSTETPLLADKPRNTPSRITTTTQKPGQRNAVLTLR